MWKHPFVYDVIVVGAGHAGCEAAHIAAKSNVSVLLLSSNLDTVAKMSCNPAIGGIGKGHIVREIDALGGLMATVTDASGIQFRMLNKSGGPAVRAPRAQVDRYVYQSIMRSKLEQIENLHLTQGLVTELLIEDDILCGVITKEQIIYTGKTVILSAGTFMQGMIHIGDNSFPGGRFGDPPSNSLSISLSNQGIHLGRLKTGTPSRIDSKSINFSLLEQQEGEQEVSFSYKTTTSNYAMKQVSCWISYTTAETKKIVQNNIQRSSLYGGYINSIGPRYCPSIEDKIVKFADKDRHLIFIEPEGLSTTEMYLNGISTSLPCDVQLELIQSIPGLENARITRPAYAIEYDYVISGQVKETLETHKIENLFICGQLNGTTGYEEAAAQGLIAGINAARKVKQQTAFSLKRHESYIGVMINDITTKNITEPYRMFTSRAEHRLLLRQDNANLRLYKHAYDLGLIPHSEFSKLCDEDLLINTEIQRFKTTYIKHNQTSISIYQILCRPEIKYSDLMLIYKDEVKDLGSFVNSQIEVSIKYAGYIQREQVIINQKSHVENLSIPDDLDFSSISTIGREAKDSLIKFKPKTLGDASRLPGITVADVQVLLIQLKKYVRT